MADLYKYGVAVHLYKPIIKRAVVDFAIGADWSPAAGDVKISKDGGAAANVTNLPTAITMGNTAMWDYSLTATEMQAAKVRISIADAATKAVEDQFFELDTYGNAAAQHAVDLTDIVRMGLTALPNAAAEAAGGLYTRGAGAGQINQQTNGQVDTNVARWLNTAVTAATTAGKPDVVVVTNTDKTGYGLSAAAVQAVWDALTAALTTVGSIGKRLADFITGDAFVRLGAPAGASIAADIAAAKVDTAAIKVQTDKLTFTVANQVDVNVLDWKSAVAPAMTGDAFARLGAPAGASVSVDIAAIKAQTAAIDAKTTNLPASPAAVGSAMTLTAGERNAVADALLDRVDGIETGWTLRQALRISTATTTGKMSGGGTATNTFRNPTDTKNRVTATVDASGNRTAVAYDVT